MAYVVPSRLIRSRANSNSNNSSLNNNASNSTIAIKRMSLNSYSKYTQEEKRQLKRGLRRLQSLQAQSHGWDKITGLNRNFAIWRVSKHSTQFNEKNIISAICVGVVADVKLSDCVSFMWDFLNPFRNKQTIKNSIHRHLTLTASDHRQRTFNRKWFPPPMKARDASLEQTWKAIDSKTVAICFWTAGLDEYQQDLKASGLDRFGAIKTNLDVFLLLEVSDEHKNVKITHMLTYSPGSISEKIPDYWVTKMIKNSFRVVRDLQDFKRVRLHDGVDNHNHNDSDDDRCSSDEDDFISLGKDGDGGEDNDNELFEGHSWNNDEEYVLDAVEWDDLQGSQQKLEIDDSINSNKSQRQPDSFQEAPLTLETIANTNTNNYSDTDDNSATNDGAGGDVDNNDRSDDNSSNTSFVSWLQKQEQANYIKMILNPTAPISVAGSSSGSSSSDSDDISNLFLLYFPNSYYNAHLHGFKYHPELNEAVNETIVSMLRVTLIPNVISSCRCVIFVAFVVQIAFSLPFLDSGEGMNTSDALYIYQVSSSACAWVF